MSEWLESKGHLEFTESDYARRLDLVAKVRGIWQAEQYIQQIPESHRREVVYCSLLRNYVAATNVHKAEKLFDTMKNLFPLTCISCNQLLFLYKRTNRKKLADVLSLMKKENIKLNNVSYQIMIEVKGQSRDIIGMEQVLETMKSDGVEPSLRNQASLAQYYTARGLKLKAEAILKDMEGGDLVKNRFASRFLLPVYAKLGREDEVGRIWKECESDPHLAECIAAMKAWGALKRIEEAEAAFDKILKTLKSPVSKHYVVLLDIYADHKLIAKGEDLFTRMTHGGTTARGPAWDALVKLYAGVGEMEKADAILEKLVRQRRGRPRATSFLNVLDEYARRGDVPNAEKVFRMMRNAGYGVEPRPYHSLLYAYMNAKAPTDGFEERLRRDNVVPDDKLARLLARAAKLSRSAVV